MRTLACSKWYFGIAIVALTFQSHSVLAQSQTTNFGLPTAHSDGYVVDDSFRRKLYGGIGLGMSRLEPDTSRVEGIDVNNRVHTAGQIMLGFDFNKWVSVEGHAATLGDAGLSPAATIGYQTFGISGLAYVGNSRSRYNRHGFSGFGRAGLGMLKNDPSEGLAFKQVNSAHILFGAGVEYATRMGLGVRAEAILFDTDVRYAQLSVLYRFGQQHEHLREMVDVEPQPEIIPKPVEKLIITPVPVPAVAIAAVDNNAVAITAVDNDNDGVLDSDDQCVNTQPGVAVDYVGCDLFAGVIEGVNFNSGSADLTANARTILSGVVSTLHQYPSVTLTIMAHTDSQGDASANKELSKQRARSVAVYLVENGVRVARLKALGFGEDRPVDTNETSAGRLRNRRVEFEAAQ